MDPKSIKFCCHNFGPSEEEQQRASEEMCEDCFIRWMNGEPFIGCDLCPSPRWRREGSIGV
jgi:hypothetical protein